MSKSTVSTLKHGFFRSLKKSDHFSFKDPDFNLNQLRTEYASLYQIFSSNKQFHTKNIEIALCADYICDVMISYYQHDYVVLELQKLYKQKKEIEAFIKASALNETHQPINKFSEYLVERLKTNFQEYKLSLTSISKFREQVGDANSLRSQINYSRSLANHGLNFLQNSNLLQEINNLLGEQYSFVEGLNLLNESRQALAILGMSLFFCRFMINLILMLKHVIHAALHDELSANKVLKQELEKRSFTMASDLVWSIISLLTTYNNLFHISSMAVPVVILAFLIFDVLLFLGQWLHVAVQYNQRLKELTEQQNEATATECAVIKRQMDILNDEWEVQCYYYSINILGACILASCFAITLLSTGPLALAGMALCSMLGNALYNTAGEYKKYQKTLVAVRREQANGVILDDAHHRALLKTLNKECDQHFAEFWTTLAFNVGGIAFIITAAVISWPVALALTASYIGYRLHKSYEKQRDDIHSPQVTHDLYRFFNTVPNEPVALESLDESDAATCGSV